MERDRGREFTEAILGYDEHIDATQGLKLIGGLLDYLLKKAKNKEMLSQGEKVGLVWIRDEINGLPSIQEHEMLKELYAKMMSNKEQEDDEDEFD